MGIKGLLALLENVQKHTHLRNFSGQTLGVDAYGWLHRGTFACATDLAQGRPTRAYVNFAMSRVRMLIHFGVTPYVVFDGDYLPSKAHTETERAERRRDSRRQGQALLQAGKIQQATQEFRKSVDVTPLMARELIEELKLAGINYVVAPYEADSQLAYLEMQGLISGIISEDSDLLVFGSQRLITKLDQYGGCVMIRRQDFTLCREISLINWSDKDFRMMALLSGCDYLPGIDKLGLKTAYRLVRKYKTIEAIVKHLQFDGKVKVPVGFLDAFYQADRTFLHQWVYCPNSRCLINLNSLPAGLSLDEMPYLGKCVEPEIAQGVARGDLDPNTKKPLLLARGFQPPRQAVQRTPSTPDLKAGKPIQEYFKSMRTPLAELDPNSFTPSPSQQRLLASQQNRSWSASQAENGRSFSDSFRRASMQNSTPRTTSLTSVRQASPTLSPRKKRLCADVLADLQGAAFDESTVSRYFNKPKVTSNTTAKAVKNSREEFDLFSDDSIVEALSTSVNALEESITTSQQTTTSPRKRKRLAIFQDEAAVSHSTNAETGGSQSSVKTLERTDSGSASFIDNQDAQGCALGPRTVSDLEKLAAPWRYHPSMTEEPDVHVPHSSPLIAVSTAELASEDETAVILPVSPAVLSLKGGLGSEDILIPQSPSSNEDDGRLKPKLDIHRFIFNG